MLLQDNFYAYEVLDTSVKRVPFHGHTQNEIAVSSNKTAIKLLKLAIHPPYIILILTWQTKYAFLANLKEK